MLSPLETLQRENVVLRGQIEELLSTNRALVVELAKLNERVGELLALAQEFECAANVVGIDVRDDQQFHLEHGGLALLQGSLDAPAQGFRGVTHAAVDDEDGVLYSQSRFDDTSFRALRMPPADSMALRGIATRLPYEHPAFEDAETLADTLMPLNINPVADNREYDSRGYHDYRRPSAYRTRSGSVALITRERRNRIIYSAIVRNDDHRIAFRLTDFSVDVG